MSWKKSGKKSAKISRKKSEIPDYLQKYFHTFWTCYGIFLVIYFFFIFFPCNILRYFLAGFFRSNFSREIWRDFWWNALVEHRQFLADFCRKLASFLKFPCYYKEEWIKSSSNSWVYYSKRIYLSQLTFRNRYLS